MRILFCLRGAPGSGKSTWVKKNNLEKYTICPDDIRVLCGSRELFADGTISTPRNNQTENETWKIVFDLLEYRMSRGEFTIIDATASKTKEMLRYVALAKQYRYRVYCIDFTKVPLDVCLAQNKQREQDKIVPEAAIRNIYARFDTQAVPSGIVTLQPDEWQKAFISPIDLSDYKKLVFIGDIHGCYDTLMQYPDFKVGLDENTNYIFIGDYFDRGNQNADVFNFIMSIKDLPNVCLLEGNHESNIHDFGNEVETKSNKFEKYTKPELLAAGITPKQARILYSKLRQCSYIKYKDKEIFACHGGVANLMENPLFVPTHAMINGTGEYKEYAEVSATWTNTMNSNQYLVYGHRNVYEEPIQITDTAINLEGKVEFGGKLRIAELSEAGWNFIELDNCQPITEELDTTAYKVETVAAAVAYLRNNEFVQEKQLGNGISSFNFTREAFYKSNWNAQTILARGLFIDTEQNKIVARSYEKFFKINEVPSTSLAALKNRLSFPVNAFVKENGFLAIVSYDYKNDDLFIASKSTNKGEYVEYIKEQIEPYRQKLLMHFRTVSTPQTYVFECIDPEHDPHIIRYAEKKLVLLDIIFNDLRYAHAPYHLLVADAEWLGCEVKELAFTINTWDEFRDLYYSLQDYDYQYKDKYIEGFVFVDQSGFMTKCKTEYYNFWKHMRGVADYTLRCGNYPKTGSLQDVRSNKFFGFCKQCYKEDKNTETKTYPYKTDIISLREKFLIENN